MVDIERFIDKDANYKYKQAGPAEFAELRCDFFENSRLSAEDVLRDTWNIFTIKADTTKDCTIRACPDTVGNIIEQVRRRTLYFHIYHEPNGLNEAKETALYTFWMLKLQPFYWGSSKGKRCSVLPCPNHLLNTSIAISFFIRGLHFYASKKSKKEGRRYQFNITDPAIQGWKHSFVYRDISKEALMDLAESLIVCEADIIALRGEEFPPLPMG